MLILKSRVYDSLYFLLFRLNIRGWWTLGNRWFFSHSNWISLTEFSNALRKLLQSNSISCCLNNLCISFLLFQDRLKLIYFNFGWVENLRGLLNWWCLSWWKVSIFNRWFLRLSLHRSFHRNTSRKVWMLIHQVAGVRVFINLSDNMSTDLVLVAIFWR